MSKPYESGEEPRVGDEVTLDSGRGPQARVVVVVGGVSAGATPDHKLKDWEYLGPGIVMDAEGLGLVFESNPDNGIVLANRHI